MGVVKDSFFDKLFKDSLSYALPQLFKSLVKFQGFDWALAVKPLVKGLDILTGGNADDVSGRTEAAVMRDILIDRGVTEDQMILEDQAASTKDNFRNTAQIIDPDRPVVLISSNYHMDRAVQTAKRSGFSDIMRLPAPSSFLSYGANVMSEVVLELNELTLKQ